MDSKYEELKRELKRLQQELDASKLSYKREIAEQRLTEEKLRESEKDLQEKVVNLSLLSEITSTFLESASKNDIYDFMGAKTLQISGADYLMISEYHEESQSVAVRQVHGIANIFEKIMKLINFDVTQVSVPVKDLDQQLPFSSRRKLYAVDGGFYVLTAGKVNKVVCKSIETMLGLRKIISAAFVWKGKYYGAITFGFKKENEMKNPELIQSIIDQASLALSQKFFEESLIDSKQRYQTLAEFSPVGIFRTDETGKTTYTNPIWNQISRLTADDMKEHPWLHAVHPDDREKLVDKWKASVKEQTATSAEFRFVHPVGSIVWVIVQILPEKNTEGKIVGYVGTATDITERKKAEKNLLLFRTLLDGSNDAIEIVDPDTGRFLDVNARGCIDLGYSREEFLALSVSDIDPMVDAPLYKKIVEELQVESHKIWEGVHQRKDGSIFPVEVNIKLVQLDRTYMVSMVRDITARKRAEEVLRESEERFRTIFNESPIGIELYNADGLQINANKTSLNMFGISNLAEVAEFNIFDGTSLTTKNKEKLRRGESVAYESAFDFEKVKELHQYMTNRSGQAYFNYVITPLLDTESKIINGYLLQVQDITERKHAEEALRSSEDKYRMLFESNPHPMWVYDLNTLSFLAVNDLAVSKYGYSKAEFLKMTLKDIRPEEDIHKLLDNVKLGVEGIEQNGSWRHRKKDGTIIDVEIVSHAIPYEGKRAKLVLAHDITEQKLAKEALQESEALYRNLVEKLPDGVYKSTHDGKFVSVNPAMVNILGYESKEELLAIDIKSQLYFEPTDRESLVLQERLEEIGIYPLKKKDGSTIWVEDQGWYNLDANGEIIFHEGILRDVTERQQAEQLLKEKNEKIEAQNQQLITFNTELILAKEKAEESDKLKTSFLNNISHEIRTPLNGLLGFLSLIQDSDTTASERGRYISIINKSADRLMNTINDIVEVSQIQAGQMKLTASIFNVRRLIGELNSRFKSEAEHKELKFFFNEDLPDSLVCINTDRTKLGATLSILLNNAIKFTKEGSIQFGICLVDTHVETHGRASLPDHRASVPGNVETQCIASLPQHLQFSVKDTGVGIPENKRNEIFKRFMQADGSDTRHFEGSGLGLSIAKTYVEILGGEIWLESNSEEISGETGTTFYFTVPFDFIPEDAAVLKDFISNNESDNHIKGNKILIVEDDQASAQLLALSVKLISKEVIKVKTGAEAVEACRSNKDIDLVLMDIKMSDIDGYEATRQIRKFNTDVVIIAQTAYALTGDRERAIEAGCNDYISKPINKNQLLELLQKYFKKLQP